MRKTIIAASLAVSVAASGIIYPTTASVTAIHGDTATVATSTGYTYTMPAEDYDTGDLVSLLMLDAGKWGRIDDDTVLSARFSGWTLAEIDD